KIYDWISGQLSLGRSVLISHKETLERVPGLRAEDLEGGVVYHDAQLDDSRLAINLAQSIWENGGAAINYMQVNGLLKDELKNVAGVTARDTETGVLYTLRAKSVVNATGVFVD